MKQLWSYYEKTFPELTKESVWAAWSDVSSWPLWDTELESTTISAPFIQGTRFTLRPKGGPNVSILMTSVTPYKEFADVTTFPLAKMYDLHEMEVTPDGLKITSIIQVEGLLGWLWWRIVARGVAEGVPKQLEALAQFAYNHQQENATHNTPKSF
jgi:hypothetical protein